MDELDFTAPRIPTISAPPPVPLFNPAVAMEFFRQGGKPEAFAQGATIFAENEKSGGLFRKRDKMYLLMEGEVSLAAAGRVIGAVKIGQVFGEMAAITDSPRSASAIAKTACRVLSMDDKSFEAALKKKPEFALMLMSIMIGRLRAMMARARGSLGGEAGRQASLFDKSMLAALERGLGPQNTVRFARGQPIFQEGQPGHMMYVVAQGRVAILIKGVLVERVEPGAMFGEMALVDQAPRMASAAADADCVLFAVNRQVFLNLVKAEPAFAASLLGAVAARVRYMAERT